MISHPYLIANMVSTLAIFLFLPGPIRVPHHGNNSSIILDILDTRKALLDILPVYDVLSIKMLDRDLLDVHCPSQTERLSLFHCGVRITARQLKAGNFLWRVAKLVSIGIERRKRKETVRKSVSPGKQNDGWDI